MCRATIEGDCITQRIPPLIPCIFITGSASSTTETERRAQKVGLSDLQSFTTMVSTAPDKAHQESEMKFWNKFFFRGTLLNGFIVLSPGPLTTAIGPRNVFCNFNASGPRLIYQRMSSTTEGNRL
ncbi:hypothetical protein NPIL_99101 [Nephila pilipes]|uniref:Uncharacterized protein n=1 Tax=Nephila pilipes TaxID=299642 RepID=A0A8X6UT94_NEPPI|nr:hypothetical protein NPIL_99101 [Nephila pilipes]